MSLWEAWWAWRVIDGERRRGVVVQTEDVVVAINPLPLGPGHALVLPRQHIADLHELPGQLLAQSC